MDFWSAEYLREVTGGRLVDPGLREPGRVDPAGAADRAKPQAAADGAGGLWHDTRQLQPGEVYLAIKGERVDGHALLPQAVEAGASLAIVTDEDAALTALAAGPREPRRIDPVNDDDRAKPQAAGSSLPLLVVDDAVAAVQAIASAWRDELAAGGCTVVSVSGSNGKTTTRTLVHHVLTSAGQRGSQAPASFNNHLGVPLTLLRAKRDDSFVALEVGTNHPGEIASLAAIARPDVAVITSIGEEHLEAFGDVTGVAKEEAAIMPYVTSGGVIFAPRAAGEWLAEHYDVQEGVAVQTLDPQATTLPDTFALPGEHNRSNATLAAAVARWLDMSPADIAQAWHTVRPPINRSTVRQLGGGSGITLIDDCYNANPASMRAAFSVLASLEPGHAGQAGRPGRRVAILGEMLELGESSATHHAAIAREARQAADVVVLLGESFADEPEHRAGDAGSLAPWLAAECRSGDVVLLKASRGMRLERLIPAIESRFVS